MSENIVLEVVYDDEEGGIEFNGAYPILDKEMKMIITKKLIHSSDFTDEEKEELLDDPFEEHEE